MTTGRDNGLRAQTYVFLATVDAQDVAEVLTELREDNIAAYALPSEPPVHSITRAVSGIQLPTERVYVDRLGLPYARALLRRRRDRDDAWQHIVEDFEREVPATEHSWPTAEDVTSSEEAQAVTEPRPPAYAEAEEDADDADDDEHYVPPPPPSLRKDDPITKAATAAIGVSLAYLVAAVAFDWHSHAWAILLAIAGVVAGVVTHVIRIRDPREPDSDDGAHV